MIRNFYNNIRKMRGKPPPHPSFVFTGAFRHRTLPLVTLPDTLPYRLAFHLPFVG